MDLHDIEYSTIEQQVEKLKLQGLIISDEHFAKSKLRYYGYSNLIKSYRSPYIIVENDETKYRSGVTFEQINPNCSGIQNTSAVDLSFALENGYIPCKRCCK